MYVFDDKNRCSGCTACKHSCPQSAITMTADNEGFKYPEIDPDKCTDCGICRAVCPFHEHYNTANNYDTPLVSAAKNKDEATRMTSSSGGVFPALAKLILEKKGIVYGAAFTDDFKVCHIGANELSEVEKLKGSKYVQSDLRDTFINIKEELRANRHVLFSGTPCQVAGLKAFLGNKMYNNLWLVDIVCHGTPSPLLWRNYIQLLEKKNKAKIRSYSFRSKRSGWHNSCLYAEFDNGTSLYNNPLLDSYNGLFYAHTALRPSCHSCVFTNFHRPSDITIADFWGIEKHKPDFDDNKGVSLVLRNNEKGKRLFEEISQYFDCAASNIEEAKQRNLTTPTKASPKRQQFWLDFNNRGYEYVAKRYTTYGVKNRIKKKIIKPILANLGIKL